MTNPSNPHDPSNRANSSAKPMTPDTLANLTEMVKTAGYYNSKIAVPLLCIRKASFARRAQVIRSIRSAKSVGSILVFLFCSSSSAWRRVTLVKSFPPSMRAISSVRAAAVSGEI